MAYSECTLKGPKNYFFLNSCEMKSCLKLKIPLFISTVAMSQTTIWPHFSVLEKQTADLIHCLQFVWGKT